MLEEGESLSRSRGYLERGLELSAARNAISRFDLPAVAAPALQQPVRNAAESDGVLKQAGDAPEPAREMMEMMLMGWRCEEEEEMSVASSRPKQRRLVPLEDRLVRLDLSSNRLGPCLLGNAISSLWRLTWLDLSSNRLTRTIGLEGAVALQTLLLARNRLTKVENLGALVVLRRLDISNNLIPSVAELRPLAIGREPTLTDLDLSDNPLRESPAAATILMRNMLPRLRRLKGLAHHDGLLAPANRLHDSYLDVHRRRTKARGPSIPRSRQTRTLPPAQRAEVAPAPSPPPIPSVATLPEHHDEGDRSTTELPWRQPPNPVPRWMLEREIGPTATTAVLRKTRQSEPPRAAAPQPAKDMPITPRSPISSVPTCASPTNVLGALEQIVRYQREAYSRRQVYS